MIINIFVAVDLAIALFALAVGCYAAFKAYKIDAAEKTATTDQRYELEKDYYLVSTVGWMTLGTRILAIPLFFITVFSLITSVPGAMCEFGVFQAGAPFSWVDLAVKMFTLFAFGGWLYFDFMNRKLKGSPLMGSLSKWFVMLLPLLFIDAALDILFFASLEPLVVPCCMVIYNLDSILTGCPFCLFTYDMPLLIGVVASYSMAAGLTIWTILYKRHLRTLKIEAENSSTQSKILTISLTLAIIGTILLIAQIIIGPFGL